MQYLAPTYYDFIWRVNVGTWISEIRDATLRYKTFLPLEKQGSKRVNFTKFKGVRKACSFSTRLIRVQFQGRYTIDWTWVFPVFIIASQLGWELATSWPQQSVRRKNILDSSNYLRLRASRWKSGSGTALTNKLTNNHGLSHSTHPFNFCIKLTIWQRSILLNNITKNMFRRPNRL